MMEFFSGLFNNEKKRSNRERMQKPRNEGTQAAENKKLDAWLFVIWKNLILQLLFQAPQKHITCFILDEK